MNGCRLLAFGKNVMPLFDLMAANKVKAKVPNNRHTTLKDVNAILGQKMPGVLLYKGKGYFYFAGEGADFWPETIVITTRLGIMSPWSWYKEALRLSTSHQP
jgi:hypothetical protein